MNTDLPNFPLPIPETRSPDHNCGGDAHLSEEESSISVDKTQGNKGPKRLKEDDTILENESKCHRTSTPETNHDVVKELKLSQPEDTDQSSNYGQVTGDNHASESQQLGNSSLLITKSKVFSSISSELDVEKSRDCQHLEGGQIPQRILEREDEVKAFAQTDEKLSSIDGEIDAKSRDCRMNKDLEHSLDREDKVYACPDGGNDTTDHHSASDTVSITSELVTRPNTSGSVDNEHHVDTTSLDSVSGRSKNSSDNEGGDSISAKRGLNGNVSASKELDYNTPTSDRSNTGSSVTKPDNDLNHEHQPDDSVTLITKLVNHNPEGGAEDTITSLPKDFSPMDGEIDVKMSRDCRMYKDLEERQIHQHSLEREDEVYDCPETDKILLDGGNETADHHSASDTVSITSELVTRPNTSGSASKELDDNTPANNRDNTDSFFTKPDNYINHEHQPDGSVTLIPKLVNHNLVGRAEDSITFFPKTDQLAISPVVVSPIDRDQTSSSQSTSLDISVNNGHKGNATTSGTQKHNSNLKLRPKHTTNSLECSGLHKEHLERPKLLSGGPAQHKQVSDRGFDDRMSSGSRTKNRASSSSNNKALGKEANFNGSVGQELDNTADVTKEVNSIHSSRNVTIDAFETGRDKGYNCAKETARTKYTSIDLSKDKNKILLQSGKKLNLKTRTPNLGGGNLKTRTPSNEELVPGVGKTKADQDFEKAHLKNVGELKYLGSKVKSTWLLWILLIFILILPTLASREKNWQQFFFCTDNTSLKNDTLTIKNLDTLSLDGCSSDVADIPHFFNCSLLKALAFVFNNTCLEMLTLDLKTQWWKMEYGKKFNGQGLSPARGELFTDEDVEKKLDSYERFRNPVSTISPTSTTELTNNGQRARWPLILTLVFVVIIIPLGAALFKSWKFLQKPPQNNHQDQQLQPTSGQEDVETAETET